MRVHAILLGHDDQIIMEREIDFLPRLSVPRLRRRTLTRPEPEPSTSFEVDEYEHNRSESELWAMAAGRAFDSVAVYRKRSA